MKTPPSVTQIHQHRPLLERTLFRDTHLGQAVQYGDVGTIVAMFQDCPDLVLRVTSVLRTISDDAVALDEAPVRVLTVACELYAEPRRALAS